jgi:hypothetical protein
MVVNYFSSDTLIWRNAVTLEDQPENKILSLDIQSTNPHSRHRRWFHLEESDNLPKYRNPSNFSGGGNLDLSESKLIKIFLESEYVL